MSPEHVRVLTRWSAFVSVMTRVSHPICAANPVQGDTLRLSPGKGCGRWVPWGGGGPVITTAPASVHRVQVLQPVSLCNSNGKVVKKFLTTHNNQVMFDIRYKHNIFCMQCLICQENISQISRNYLISLQNWICIYVQPHGYHGHCSHADHRPRWHR